MIGSMTRNRRLIPVGTAAKQLGLSIWTLRGWCYRGRCASHKLGNRLMLDESEVERIISESERPRLVSSK
jgi:predicted site-specific integrase-resolvase